MLDRKQIGREDALRSVGVLEDTLDARNLIPADSDWIVIADLLVDLVQKDEATPEGIRWEIQGPVYQKIQSVANQGDSESSNEEQPVTWNEIYSLILTVQEQIDLIR